MILFFKTTTQSIIATQFNHQPTQEEIDNYVGFTERQPMKATINLPGFSWDHAEKW